MLGAECEVQPGLVFELVQPLDGPSIYKEWLEEHGEGVQHIACMMHSQGDSDAVQEATGRPAGPKVLMGGRIGETIEFYYLDTEPMLKFVLESGQRSRDRPDPRSASTRPPRPDPAARRGRDPVPPQRATRCGSSSSVIPSVPSAAFRAAFARPGRRARGDVRRRRRRARLRRRDPVRARAQGVHGQPGPGHRRARPATTSSSSRARRSRDAVLDAAPTLRLVCCARGGPVNVDVGGRDRAGHPGRDHAGQERRRRRRADDRASWSCSPAGCRRSLRHVEGGGEFGHDNYEGAHWFGHDLAGHILGLVGFGQIGRRVAPGRCAFGMPVARRTTRSSTPATIDGGRRRAGRPRRRSSTRSDVVSAPRPGDGRQPRAHRRGRDRRDEARRATSSTPPATLSSTRPPLVDGLASRAGWPGRRFDVVSPSPATRAATRCSPSPTSIIAPHIGGATYETLHHGGEMAAAEIERLVAGEPLVNVANRDGARRSARRDRPPDAPPPRHRPRDRQLPGDRSSTRTAARSAIGQREWTHAGPARRARARRSSTPPATGG